MTLPCVAVLSLTLFYARNAFRLPDLRQLIGRLMVTFILQRGLAAVMLMRQPALRASIKMTMQIQHDISMAA